MGKNETIEGKGDHRTVVFETQANLRKEGKKIRITARDRGEQERFILTAHFRHEP